MATNVAQVRFGAQGSILAAPVGSTIPTDVTAAWDDAFVDLGRADDSGVTLTDSKTIGSWTPWGGFYPDVQRVTARDFTAAFNLTQFNATNVQLGFGGGTVTRSGTSGSYVYTYAPPDPQFIDYRCLGVEWEDSGYTYRLVLLKALATENVTTQVQSTNPMALPITMSVAGVDGATPWKLVTNDPAFETS